MTKKRNWLILAAVLLVIIAWGISRKQVTVSKKPVAVCGKTN